MKKEELDALAKGVFSLDCPIMELHPINDNSPKPIYKGSGYICSARGGEGFDIKLYCHNAISFNDGFQATKLEPGKVLDDEDLYRLKAVDLDNREWICLDILPDSILSNPYGVRIVRAIADKLLTSSAFSGQRSNHALLYIQGHLPFPSNTLTNKTMTIGEREVFESWELNVAKVEAAGFSFEIINADGYCRVAVVSKESELNEVVIRRVREALSFVFGCNVDFAAICDRTAQNEKWQIINTSKIYDKGYYQPLRGTSPSVAESFWKLFDTFLSHILKDKDEKWSHPLSHRVALLFNSPTVPAENQSLVLAVNIEGFVKNILKNKNNQTLDPTLKEDSDKLKDHINTTDYSKTFKERINGMLGSMNDIRAKDYLQELVTQKTVSKELFNVWQDQRNSAAHGTIPEYNKEHIQQYDKMVTLFFQLVFIIIQYNDKYTDYSSPGYPEKVFKVLSLS